MNENKKIIVPENHEHHYELDSVLDGVGSECSMMACEKKCIRCDVSSSKCSYN